LKEQPVIPTKVYVPTSPGPDYHTSQDLRSSVAVSLVPHSTTSGFTHTINSITGALGIRPTTYPYSQNSFVPLKMEQHSGGNSSGMSYDNYYELPKPLPLMKHEYQEDGRVQYKCGFCKKVIAFSELFHKHLKSHVTKTANKCDLCNINFAFRSNLFRHIRRYHIEYVCAMCNAVCPRPKQLEQHLHVHHSEVNAVVREVSLR
jgi:DNA-directed RNA polymerase subunit RPC12/RpoP